MIRLYKVIILVFLFSCTKESKRMIYSSLEEDTKLYINGDSIEKKIYFINYSDSSIKIIDHRTSCGCTLVALNPNMIIPSGDSLYSLISIHRIGNEKKNSSKEILISIKFDRSPYIKTYKITAVY